MEASQPDKVSLCFHGRIDHYFHEHELGWPHLRDMEDVVYIKCFTLLISTFTSKTKQVHNSYVLT